MPFALATGMGSTFDCADHSNSVCLRARATISSPVIAVCVSVAAITPFPRPGAVTDGPRRHGDTEKIRWHLRAQYPVVTGKAVKCNTKGHEEHEETYYW